MVKIGHAGSREIVRVPYNPPASYHLDLEAFPVSELRRRVSIEFLGKPERIEFYLLICVTEGRCRHMADFELMECGRGSLLILRPGQVHRFDPASEWQGWVVIFRPEFLTPMDATMDRDTEVLHQVEGLPMHLILKDTDKEAVLESIARILNDVRIQASARILNVLLRNQLHAILIRLHLIDARRGQGKERAAVAVLERFRRYRLAVEKDFHRWHQVTDYAKALGCSEKSLNRAANQIAGVSAKTFISQRVALEAKRLLAHTLLPSSVIGDELGFDEATNFVKFFRREAGCSPGEFRRLQTGLQVDFLRSDPRAHPALRPSTSFPSAQVRGRSGTGNGTRTLVPDPNHGDNRNL